MFSNRLLGALALLALLSTPVQAEPNLESFESARQAFTGQTGCESTEHLKASYDHGDLTNCVLGDSRTLVYELEKSRSGEQVHRVKLTWFDFEVQNPDGAPQYLQHGGQDDAEDYVTAFLDAYVPCRRKEVLEEFFALGECECVSADGKFDVAVRQFQNDSLVERSVEVRPRRQ